MGELDYAGETPEFLTDSDPGDEKVLWVRIDIRPEATEEEIDAELALAKRELMDFQADFSDEQREDRKPFVE